MLLKKIIGIFIIVLNTAGFGFLLYMIARDRFFPSKQPMTAQSTSVKKKDSKIVNDNILSEEDDLLKDMDLSDLDNLDLDDFD